MMDYKTMREKHQLEVNEFPLGFAFGDKQFEEMMKKWGRQNLWQGICLRDAGL